MLRLGSSKGVPEENIKSLLVLFEEYRHGVPADVNDHVSNITGKEPRGLKQDASEFKGSWVPQVRQL